MKPYIYLDRHDPASRKPALTRTIPTTIGGRVRAAFHGIGDGSRSLEVYVQPNGF